MYNGFPPAIINSIPIIRELIFYKFRAPLFIEPYQYTRLIPYRSMKRDIIDNAPPNANVTARG